MRSKSPELKAKIYDFVNSWRRDNGWSPSMTEIAEGVGISRNTAYRYIIEMTEDGSGLTYDGKVIGTREMCADNSKFSKAMVVGSIPCGEPTSEEQFVDAYVNLPVNLFGKGDFYILRASAIPWRTPELKTVIWLSLRFSRPQMSETSWLLWMRSSKTP